MGEFSITHWLIVIAVLLIFFGPSRLPGLGKSLGEAIKGFKDGIAPEDKNNQAQQQQQQQQLPPSPPSAQLNQPQNVQPIPVVTPVKKDEHS